MACDHIAAFPYSTITCMIMTFFFSLLLAFDHFAIAVPERSLSTLASIEEGAKKRSTNMMVAAAASAREEGISTQQNLKTKEETTKGNNNNHVSDLLNKGNYKEGSFQSPRPPLERQNKIFNASEHEVPSGPNPISNR